MSLRNDVWGLQENVTASERRRQSSFICHHSTPTGERHNHSLPVVWFIAGAPAAVVLLLLGMTKNLERNCFKSFGNCGDILYKKKIPLKGYKQYLLIHRTAYNPELRFTLLILQLSYILYHWGSIRNRGGDSGVVCLGGASLFSQGWWPFKGLKAKFSCY